MEPTQQPGLWFHGGNLRQARHYSLYLALQLKARYEGLPTPVYFMDPCTSCSKKSGQPDKHDSLRGYLISR